MEGKTLCLKPFLFYSATNDDYYRTVCESPVHPGESLCFHHSKQHLFDQSVEANRGTAAEGYASCASCGEISSMRWFFHKRWNGLICNWCRFSMKATHKRPHSARMQERRYNKPPRLLYRITRARRWIHEMRLTGHRATTADYADLWDAERFFKYSECPERKGDSADAAWRNQDWLVREFVICFFERRCPNCNQEKDNHNQWAINWKKDSATCRGCNRIKAKRYPFRGAILPLGVAVDPEYGGRPVAVEDIFVPEVMPTKKASEG